MGWVQVIFVCLWALLHRGRCYTLHDPETALVSGRVPLHLSSARIAGEPPWHYSRAMAHDVTSLVTRWFMCGQALPASDR